MTILDGVTGIGDEAFRGCSSLTSVAIPDSVSSIGDSSFRACTSLTSVTIPASVTSIGKQAFVRSDYSSDPAGNEPFDSSVTDVYYGGSEAQWGEIVTNETTFADGGQKSAGLGSATIHYNS